MISAISWVPKGAAKNVPEILDPPSKEELEEAMRSWTFDGSAELEDGDEEMDMDAGEEKANDEVEHATAAAKALSSGGHVDDISNGLKELDMDHYDDDDHDGFELFTTGLGDLYYPTNELDPNLKNNDDDDEDEEDIEDMTIRPTDQLILCATSEEDLHQLEAWILEELDDGSVNMYVHHDMMLSSYPLCTAWLDCSPNSSDKGNFVAVGTMDPSIEIWDVDQVNGVKPCSVLGGVSKKKKKEGKKKKFKKGSHRDAVLGLAWNKSVRNVLASASADKTVKIWDVATGECVVTLDHHSDKVQAVSWNMQSPEVLLTGSFDKTVAMMDMKEPGRHPCTWSVESDVECIIWSPHDEHSFLVSLENGMVQAFDRRAASSSPEVPNPIFNLHAHEKAVTTLSLCPTAHTLLATASTDKMVKLWDLSNDQPSSVASQNPKAGAIFSIAFTEDRPFLLAIGGSKGRLQVWDTMSDPRVSNRYVRK